MTSAVGGLRESGQCFLFEDPRRPKRLLYCTVMLAWERKGDFIAPRASGPRQREWAADRQPILVSVKVSLATECSGLSGPVRSPGGEQHLSRQLPGFYTQMISTAHRP